MAKPRFECGSNSKAHLYYRTIVLSICRGPRILQFSTLPRGQKINLWCDSVSIHRLIQATNKYFLNITNATRYCVRHRAYRNEKGPDSHTKFGCPYAEPYGLAETGCPSWMPALLGKSQCPCSLPAQLWVILTQSLDGSKVLFNLSSTRDIMLGALKRCRHHYSIYKLISVPYSYTPWLLSTIWPS